MAKSKGSVKGYGEQNRLYKRPIPRPSSKTPKEAPNVDKRAKLDADGWMDSGRWVGVKSSNVAGIRYNRPMKRLYVEFKGKKGSPDSVYQYDGVPPQTARAMFGTGSMGSFVWKRLRGKFPYAKIK